MPAHFTPELFKFLKQLKADNTAEWFQKNKPRYEEHVKAPMLAFIADLAPGMAKISKQVRVDAKALKRMNRDTRFSKDKSPYKTTVDARFMLEGAGESMLGYCLSLQPGDCRAYTGIWQPEPPLLSAIRARVIAKPKDWTAAAGPAFRKSFEFEGESLKRPPQGVPDDHPLLDDLKRKSFAAYTSLDEKTVCSGKFLDAYLESCRAGAPLMRFVCDALTLKF